MLILARRHVRLAVATVMILSNQNRLAMLQSLKVSFSDYADRMRIAEACLDMQCTGDEARADTCRGWMNCSDQLRSLSQGDGFHFALLPKRVLYWRGVKPTRF